MGNLVQPRPGAWPRGLRYQPLHPIAHSLDPTSATMPSPRGLRQPVRLERALGLSSGRPIATARRLLASITPCGFVE